MNTDLPPTQNPQELERELALVPKGLREDALQEAWLAHIEGRSPCQAVNTFMKREKRYRARQTVMSDMC